ARPGAGLPRPSQMTCTIPGGPRAAIIEGGETMRTAHSRYSSRFAARGAAAAFMTAYLGLAGPVSHAQPPSAGAKAPPAAQGDARPGVEAERKQVQESTQSSLDK